MLEIINEFSDNSLGKVPCFNSIKNWILKCGLNTYNNVSKNLSGENYAVVIDESMMIGSCKSLLTLAIPAKHHGKPISHADTMIIGINNSDSFNGESVGDCLMKSVERIGHKPQYVICDNDHKIINGVKSTGIRYHLDITHSLGMFLERTYKSEDDFINFTKQMSLAQFKYNMRKEAYLLPPRQRTISRFINLDNWVKWASRVLEKYHILSKSEQEMLFFIPQSASFINEMTEVMKCIRHIESICKYHGLSKDTAQMCIKNVLDSLMGQTERMRALGTSIIHYITNEVKWLDKEDCHNNSTDIIESVFGIFKRKKSPNKLYGVTSYILSLASKPAFSTRRTTKKVDIKLHLETVKMKHISKWRSENIPQNLVTKRIKVLAS